MEMICAHCQTPYHKSPSRLPRTKYCSRKCASAARKLAPRSVPCRSCGKPATQDRRKRVRNFCSKICASRWTAKNRKTTKGRYVTSKGYVAIYRPDHPNASKAGYVMEHRLVMEARLRRLLLPSEIVHHNDGDRAHNGDDNLDLMTKVSHDKLPKVRTGKIHCPHCAQLIRLSRPARVVGQISRA